MRRMLVVSFDWTWLLLVLLTAVVVVDAGQRGGGGQRSAQCCRSVIRCRRYHNNVVDRRQRRRLMMGVTTRGDYENDDDYHPYGGNNDDDDDDTKDYSSVGDDDNSGRDDDSYNMDYGNDDDDNNNGGAKTICRRVCLQYCTGENEAPPPPRPAHRRPRPARPVPPSYPSHDSGPRNYSYDNYNNNGYYHSHSWSSSMQQHRHRPNNMSMRHNGHFPGGGRYPTYPRPRPTDDDYVSPPPLPEDDDVSSRPPPEDDNYVPPRNDDFNADDNADDDNATPETCCGYEIVCSEQRGKGGKGKGGKGMSNGSSSPMCRRVCVERCPTVPPPTPPPPTPREPITPSTTPAPVRPRTLAPFAVPSPLPPSVPLPPPATLLPMPTTTTTPAPVLDPVPSQPSNTPPPIPTPPPIEPRTMDPTPPPRTTPTTTPPITPSPTPQDDPVDPDGVVPNTCQVDLLIDTLEFAVVESPNRAIAPKWLRLAFHDAGTFNVQVPEGGANGCLLTDDAMRREPENHSLDLAVETLRFVQNRMINAQPPELAIRLSSADLIQFAGFFVAVRQRGTPGLDEPKREELRNAFVWGRPDETNCQVQWTKNLPGFALDTEPTNIPLRCSLAGREIRVKMIERNGFTAREATALIGAHTIGLTRNEFGPDLAGPWVENGADDATPQGPIFDNAYHEFLIDTIPATTVEEFSAGQTADQSPPPFTETFPNWFRVEPSDLNHLDTDLALAFPSQDTNVHPHYDSFSREFASSNSEFINSFMAALDKMSKLGVQSSLSPTRICLASAAAPTDAIPTVSTFTDGRQSNSDFFASVDTAEARLDATLVERQDTIATLTTPVNFGRRSRHHHQ